MNGRARISYFGQHCYMNINYKTSFNLIILLLTLLVGYSPGGFEVALAGNTSIISVPENLHDLIRRSELVVVAEVQSIKKGRRIKIEENILQFEDIRLKIRQVVKGERIESIVVERASIRPRRASSEIGPEYKMRESYLLFLVKGDNNRHVVINQGRYLLQKAVVRSTQPGNVSELIDGESIQTLIKKIEEMSRK